MTNQNTYIYRDNDERFQDVETSIQVGLLGFCSCGRPEENLLYIHKGLNLIIEVGPYGRDEYEKWYADHLDRVIKHFGSLDSAYFFYYWADKEGFTEHGGSVPGWLTDKGRDLLKLLGDYKATQDRMEEME